MLNIQKNPQLTTKKIQYLLRINAQKIARIEKELSSTIVQKEKLFSAKVKTYSVKKILYLQRRNIERQKRIKRKKGETKRSQGKLKFQKQKQIRKPVVKPDKIQQIKTGKAKKQSFNFYIQVSSHIHILASDKIFRQNFKKNQIYRLSDIRFRILKTENIHTDKGKEKLDLKRYNYLLNKLNFDIPDQYIFARQDTSFISFLQSQFDLYLDTEAKLIQKELGVENLALKSNISFKIEKIDKRKINFKLKAFKQDKYSKLAEKQFLKRQKERLRKRTYRAKKKK